MAYPQQLDLDLEERQTLGLAYVRKVEEVETARERLLQDTYIQAMKNYEGKAKPRTFPWPGASNVVLPVTPTDTDSIFSRLYSASTFQDPVYNISSWPPEEDELAPGITVKDYADALQCWSSYAESELVKNSDVMEKVCLLFTKYGDAIVYCPYVYETFMDFTLDTATGAFSPGKETPLLDQPMPYVIHPKNFYVPIETEGGEGIQLSQWAAFDLDVTFEEGELKAKRKEWNEEAWGKIAEHIKERKKSLGKKDSGYYQEWGDGKVLSPDAFAEQMRQQVGIDAPQIEETANAIRMVKVFAREDIDGDGFPENIELIVHRATGHVVQVHYNPWAHKQRPLVHFYFVKRDGIFYSIGVPEMLFNLQKIMNTVMRDILDNNKVQNTKMFLARKGGPITQDMRAFPSRVWMVDSVEADLKPIDMGSGRPVTSVQDLAILTEWTQRRTGQTEAHLGRQQFSRTPVHTTLALLEEGNKRLDIVIRRMRDSQRAFWTQVLQLFAQFVGDMELMRKVIGVERATVLETVWAAATPSDIQKRLIVRARVSSQNLNRSTQRQEAMALFGQIQVYYEQIVNLAQALTATKQDPFFQELFLAMAKGGHKVMERVLDTFDVKDQENLNPAFEEMLQNVQQPIAPEGGPQRGDQVQQALALLEGEGASAGPANAAWRPVAGLPRAPA